MRMNARTRAKKARGSTPSNRSMASPLLDLVALQRGEERLGPLVRLVRPGQLPEHRLQRPAQRTLQQRRRRLVGDDLALVDDDDALAEALDDLEDVRAEQDRLAALQQA